MNREDIYQAITDLDDKLVAGAVAEQPEKIRHWKRWAAVAACIAVVIGVAACYLLPLRMQTNGTSDSGVNPTEEGASTFMSYAGPVFPLTLWEENDAIAAMREITLDFEPWIGTWWSNEDEAASRTDKTDDERREVKELYDSWYPEGGRWISSSDIAVTDTYTLTNGSDRDQTLKVLYPFAGSLRSLQELLPTLTADGRALSGTVHAGGYGGDEGTLGNWEDYRDVMSDGTYLENALTGYPVLSGTKVIVYEFTDPWGEPADEKAGIPNPTIRVDFRLDYEKTTVLSVGFNGLSQDPDEGWMNQQFSIPQQGNGEDAYRLIVVGDDIWGLTTQGYVTGGWDTDETIESGVTVTRYEADLEDVLRKTVSEMYDKTVDDMPGVDFEMYFGLFKDWLISDGPLSDSDSERYGTGWLWENNVMSFSRVFWLEAEVTVPAGGSVELTASMRKEASFDFYCGKTENRGVAGYDLVTRLGSNLNCTAQTAVLEDRGQIEIVRQNFGFDIEQGIKTVTLTEEEYYLEVRRSPDTEK